MHHFRLSSFIRNRSINVLQN